MLGSPRIELDGSAIEFDTRKAIALLAYLAVTGMAHRRDALAALLWPEADPKRARAALRRTLSSLRKTGEGLRIGRDAVGLDTESEVRVDVAKLGQLRSRSAAHSHAGDDGCPICIVALTEASELYRGDFLEGFSLRDSPGFDDWQLRQAETLRRDLARVLQGLIHHLSAAGRYEQAMPYARRWLALDSLDESAHRQIMRLHSSAGDRSAALRQYRECVRILDQELSVTPLEETTQLYQSIRENRPSAALVATQRRPVPAEGSDDLNQPSDGVPAVRQPHAYPLVGRTLEWEILTRTYGAMVDDGHMVVLEGEAGIGKTRMAEDFLSEIRRTGAVTFEVRCYRGESSLAYAPFIEMLRRIFDKNDREGGWLAEVQSEWLSEASRLLPELRSLHPGLTSVLALDSPGAQSRFFDAIIEIISASTRGALPGVILVDDLHWADESSIDLVTYLVRRLRGRRLCLLATWRSENVTAEHRLRLLLAEAQRSGVATSIPLPRLGFSDVRSLVLATGTQQAIRPQGFEERLYRETEGLPFFVVEYLTTLDGNTRSVDDDAWSIPSGVRDLLLLRLAGLSETGRQLLDTAAVIGRSFDFDTVQHAAGRSDEVAVAALEELISQGLVYELSGEGPPGYPPPGYPRYDFSHEQLRAVAYEETSLARRRLLHRRVAEALAVRSGRGGGPGALDSQVAMHYRMAGEDSSAARHYQRAGQEARALFANAEAMRHFQSALELGHPDAVPLHESIGDLQTLSGDYGAALKSYEIAAALCEPGLLGRIERKLGAVHHRLGEWDLADSHFEAARDSYGEEEASPDLARLYGDWSLNAHRKGDPRGALSMALRAAEIAQTTNDTGVVAQAHNMLGVLARSRADFDEAFRQLEMSLKLAEALRDPSARVAVLNNLALAQIDAGDQRKAIEVIEAALDLCASQGDRHREAALHNNLADMLHASGRPEDAMAHLTQAVTIFAEIGVDSGALHPEIWKLVEW